MKAASNGSWSLADTARLAWLEHEDGLGKVKGELRRELETLQARRNAGGR
jgi:hypothetical protein